jgi:hypothetical protein
VDWERRRFPPLTGEVGGENPFSPKKKTKSRFDLLAGKQQSIERALRAVNPWGKVPS